MKQLAIALVLLLAGPLVIARPNIDEGELDRIVLFMENYTGAMSPEQRIALRNKFHRHHRTLETLVSLILLHEKYVGPEHQKRIPAIVRQRIFYLATLTYPAHAARLALADYLLGSEEVETLIRENSALIFCNDFLADAAVTFENRPAFTGRINGVLKLLRRPFDSKQPGSAIPLIPHSLEAENLQPKTPNRVFRSELLAVTTDEVLARIKQVLGSEVVASEALQFDTRSEGELVELLDHQSPEYRRLGLNRLCDKTTLELSSLQALIRIQRADWINHEDSLRIAAALRQQLPLLLAGELRSRSATKVIAWAPCFLEVLFIGDADASE